MADIFVSYAKEDIERVRPLIEILEWQDWSVVWDYHLAHGETRSDYIEEELRAARCVVVVWTRTSVNRPRVLEEAEAADYRNVLIPVFMDPVEAPLGFGGVKGAWLGDWTGDPNDVDLVDLCWKVERRLKRARRGGFMCRLPPSTPWWRAWWRGPSW